MKKNNNNRLSSLIKPSVFFIIVISLLVSTQMFALGALSYLGTFSRHLADDYCESAVVQNATVISAVSERYLSGSSNRYSNLLLVGLAETVSKNNIQVFPFFMIFLWGLGSVWVVRGVRQLAEIHWPIIMDVLLAVSIMFFSAWQASNRYQTFLWRSGMATHFAPLVFIFLLFGFILSQINRAKKPSFLVCFFVFLSSSIVGGFSEPPAVFLIAMIITLILFMWRWDNHVKRRLSLFLFASSLIGVILALMIMFFSPTLNSLGGGSFMDSLMATLRTFRFTINFMDDTVRTKPLPSLVSFLSMFIVFFVFFFKSDGKFLTLRNKQQISTGLILVPLIQYLLIAASFAPSAYGESYPADRAQFIGRVVMTTALLSEGALLGVLFADFVGLFPRRKLLFLLGNLALFSLVFYPLRAGLVLMADVPGYRQWTAQWDLRETEISKAVAMGERDLVVRWLPAKEGVKEIDASVKHWVNGCAAIYYNVNSIRSVSMNRD